jgi:homogentisate 1,2-dioxygenase
VLARPILRGEPHAALPGGFGAFHETEDLPGALPKAQNSPLPAPYGLVPEQVNATGFTVARHANVRSWLYRVRPSAQQRDAAPLAHPTLTHDFEARASVQNLMGFRAPRIPEHAVDFVDGLATVGGAGSPRLRRGFAIHTFVANRSMNDRAFCTVDGSLLLVPELGSLRLLTELGVLEVAPGSIALLPRGLRFSVLLDGTEARGYVAEVFGRGFELPERGPVGANGLADARHFRAPKAWHEDRLAVGFALTIKTGGALYQATQDYSPFDVVAWHGNYAPYTYELANFSPVANVRVDHADPSVYTVLSAPLDEPGSNALDFVVFVPRWDPTEHTFRPPYFHRNATTEFNGIIAHGGHGPFEAGGYFLTPAMVPHGIVAGRLPHSRPDVETPPARPTQGSLWFQFETTLPFALASLAESAPNRIDDWRSAWGGYRSHFRPGER